MVKEESFFCLRYLNQSFGRGYPATLYSVFYSSAYSAVKKRKEREFDESKKNIIQYSCGNHGLVL